MIEQDTMYTRGKNTIHALYTCSKLIYMQTVEIFHLFNLTKNLAMHRFFQFIIFPVSHIVQVLII